MKISFDVNIMIITGGGDYKCFVDLILTNLENRVLAGILEKRNSIYRQLEENEKSHKELQEQIDQMQGLANIGMLSSMIAHEMNNILTPLGSFAQLAMKYPDDAELTQKALQKAITHSEKAGKIITSILSMAKGDCKEKLHCNLSKLVDDVFLCIARDFKKDGIMVAISIPDDLEIFTEQVSFQQVLMNLIINARQAMLDNGGTLTVKASHNDDQVRIDITDTGRGIDSDVLGKIFEPFFSTKRSGTGLGLAFCKRVVQSHNGFICVNSEQDSGTTFSVIIPHKGENEDQAD